MNKKQLVKKLIKNANESSKWITRQFGKQIIINGRCLVTDGCNALLMRESYMDLEGESACCCSLEVKKMIDKVYNMAVSPEYYIPCKKFDVEKLKSFEKDHRYTTSPRRKATQSGFLRFGATTGYPIKMIIAMLDIMPNAVVSYGEWNEPIHFWDAKNNMIGLVMPSHIDYNEVKRDAEGFIVDADYYAPLAWNFEMEE